MNEKDIELVRMRILQPEDAFTERKRTPQEREVQKAGVAFANSLREGESGYLFLGVEDNGKIVGVENADSQQAKIRGWLSSCYPLITYQCFVIQHEAKDIIVVKFEYSRNGPHFAGAAFIRSGAESVKASEQVFDQLVAKRNGKARRLIENLDKPALIRSKSKSGFFFDTHEKVVSCDAISIAVQDNVGNTKSFPLEQVEITHNSVYPLIVVHPTLTTEEEQLRRMVELWSINQNPDSYRIDEASPYYYLAKQLLAHPTIARDAVASVMDGQKNLPLRSLLMHLEFERKKIENPMSKVQKDRRLIQKFTTIVISSPLSYSLVLGAVLSAIKEVATSLDEIDDFIATIRRNCPHVPLVSNEIIYNALFF